MPIAPGNTLDAALQHVNGIVANKKTKGKESSLKHFNISNRFGFMKRQIKRPELVSNEKSC